MRISQKDMRQVYKGEIEEKYSAVKQNIYNYANNITVCQIKFDLFLIFLQK